MQAALLGLAAWCGRLILRGNHSRVARRCHELRVGRMDQGRRRSAQEVTP